MRSVHRFAIVAVVVAVSACGSGGPDETTTTDPTPEATVSVEPTDVPLTSTVRDTGPQTATISDIVDDPPAELPAELTALEGVDLDAAFGRACLGWSFLEDRDHSAINDPVSDFLTSIDPRGNGIRDSPLLDVESQEAVNAAITNACAGSNAEEGWVILANGLGLSNDEFSVLVDASCENFRSSEPFRSERAGWHVDILTVVGVDDLQPLIDQLCGP